MSRSISEAIGIKYKTIDDNKHMGLYNKICKQRDYFCSAKRVWLCEKDVKRKQCKCKPDIYMIGTSKCPYLLEAKKVNINRNQVGHP